MYPLSFLFSSMRQRPPRPILLVVLGAPILAALLSVGFTTLLGSPRAVAAGTEHGEASRIKPLTQIPPGAQRVEVGMYPITFYSLNEETNTYYADTYMWFIWKGDKDPTETMELVNAVEEWSMVRKNLNNPPVKLPDGRRLQLVHVEGRFFQPFALGRFPFDEHHLTIQLEDTTYTSRDLVYVVDEKHSGYDELLKIPGWNIGGWKMEGLQRTYPTNFGDPAVGHDESHFAHLRYELTISRPLSYFGWRLFLPLVITMILTWSALLIHPEKVEPRTALPATGLLTAVLLQLGYSEQLPDIGHLMLMDKIYVLAYVLIVFVLAEAIIMARWAHHEAEKARVARAHRLDRVMLGLQIISFGVGVAYLIRFG
jgi:hypothetical protein